MPDSTQEELIDGATTDTTGFPTICPRLVANLRADALSDINPVGRATPHPEPNTNGTVCYRRLVMPTRRGTKHVTQTVCFRLLIPP